jgi:hypothetical protein
MDLAMMGMVGHGDHREGFGTGVGILRNKPRRGHLKNPSKTWKIILKYMLKYIIHAC